jgi:hypothetical protein
VLWLFRMRADAALLQEYDRLASVRDPRTHSRAKFLLLSQLTTEELSAIGVGQSIQRDSVLWCLARSLDQNSGAILTVLKRAQIAPAGVGGLGGTSWHVRREDFFRAREALLESELARLPSVTIISPTFELPC